MKKDYDRERRIAQRIFREPCIGKNDRYHGGNCGHCCLRGLGKPNTADGKGKEPNYSGWARLYVQAGVVVPQRFAEAFENEKQSANELYRDALLDDIHHYGVVFKN